jgi:hypothetical protein
MHGFSVMTDKRIADSERRRYRFRAWHKVEKKLYPVLWWGRGGVIIEDELGERTCVLQDMELMQYTGLHDVLGAEIYEQDVVALHRSEGAAQGEVELEDGSFVVHLPGEAVKLSRQLIHTQHGTIVATSHAGRS